MISFTPVLTDGIEQMELRAVPRISVFYHYFYPDGVVSAIHLSELCEELVRRGWDVTARPGNRSCRHKAPKYAAREHWKGVTIRRIWRPAFSQASSLGRVSNALWMLLRWSLTALWDSPDFVIIGTDPVMSVLVAPVWKLFRPATLVAHWCFDLYPEAAMAGGILRPDCWFVSQLKRLLKRAYQSCDLLVDLGSCMQRRLQYYQPTARQITLTPWALREPGRPLPINLLERQSIFGNSRLALLYSGNFGRAHCSELILLLAGRLAPHGAHLAFSVRGNCFAQLQHKAASAPNVVLIPFAAQTDLETRLSAADIHMVSLREGWTGTVVPSKFFGALAVGRPVLFAGSPESSIAEWIREYKVGWVLTELTLESVLDQLLHYCHTPNLLTELFEHCHAVYQRYFSKKSVADQWDLELRRVLMAPHCVDEPRVHKSRMTAPSGSSPVDQVETTST